MKVAFNPIRTRSPESFSRPGVDKNPHLAKRICHYVLGVFSSFSALKCAKLSCTFNPVFIVPAAILTAIAIECFSKASRRGSFSSKHVTNMKIDIPNPSQP